MYICNVLNCELCDEIFISIKMARKFVDFDGLSMCSLFSFLNDKAKKDEKREF